MNMKNNKINSNLRIAFSSIALISFVLFSLCNNLIVTEHSSYYTYEWRVGVINDIFLFVPYAALLIISLIERKLKYISPCVYVAEIFSLNIIQTAIMGFVDEASDFSIFCCGTLGRSPVFSDVFIIVRLAMLVLTLIKPHKIILKIYSLAMIAFFGTALVATLTSNTAYISYIYSSRPEIIAELAVDILFYIALFFFNDLMVSNNKIPDSIDWEENYNDEE